MFEFFKIVNFCSIIRQQRVQRMNSRRPGREITGTSIADAAGDVDVDESGAVALAEVKSRKFEPDSVVKLERVT
jgi:hypothetical protein